MLGVDIEQAPAQLLHRGERCGQVAHERTALAGRRDDASQDDLFVVVQLVLLEKRLQTEPPEREQPLHDAVFRSILHGRTVVLVAQQQPQRPQQNRLAGTRFTRYDVQMLVQLQFEVVDQRVIFNRQTS